MVLSGQHFTISGRSFPTASISTELMGVSAFRFSCANTEGVQIANTRQQRADVKQAIDFVMGIFLVAI